MVSHRAYAVGRRSAKPALGSVERAPVGPVVAVYRHTVASFIKVGSDAVYAIHGAVPKGKVGVGDTAGRDVRATDHCLIAVSRVCLIWN